MSDGKICLDILGSKWLSCLNVTAILFSIQQLLDEPNPLDPANNVAALMFTENPQEYQKRVKICVDRTKVLPPLRPRQTRYLLRSSRITDSWWGNRLHCTAKNQLTLPNFQIRPMSATSAQNLQIFFSFIPSLSVVRDLDFKSFKWNTKMDGLTKKSQSLFVIIGLDY